MTTLHPVPDDALGNTSYLVDLGDGLAMAVDPRREAETYLEIAERLGLRMVASLETHLHADFVTGSRELADTGDVEVVAARGADVGFDHRAVGDGDELEWAGSLVRVVATPGHTPEHVAYILEGATGPVGVFSGGSMIAGGAARTDLTGSEHTESLARDQFRSLRTLASLPDEVALWPTHGAGSFCSTGPSAGGVTTIGDQRSTNPLLAIDDEDAFVRHLLGGFGSYPPYFLELRSVNRAGPALRRELTEPRPLAPADVAERVDEGAWLIDARPIDEWARGHPRGAVSNQLRSAFASWLGWIVPLGAPVVLVIDEAQVGEAVMLAGRIGHDRLVGWLDGGVAAWRDAGLPVDSVETVDGVEAGRRVESGATLVDVRQAAELENAKIPDAIHLELGDVIGGQVPDAGQVVTFCGHGERSATAASLLERRGIAVANLVGGLPAWEKAGLPVRR